MAQQYHSHLTARARAAQDRENPPSSGKLQENVGWIEYNCSSEIHPKYHPKLDLLFYWVVTSLLMSVDLQLFATTWIWPWIWQSYGLWAGGGWQEVFQYFRIISDKSGLETVTAPLLPAGNQGLPHYIYAAVFLLLGRYQCIAMTDKVRHWSVSDLQVFINSLLIGLNFGLFSKVAITHAVESSCTVPSILATCTHLTLPGLVSRQISASHTSCSPLSVTSSATSSDSIDFAVYVPRSNSDTAQLHNLGLYFWEERKVEVKSWESPGKVREGKITEVLQRWDGWTQEVVKSSKRGQEEKRHKILKIGDRELLLSLEGTVKDSNSVISAICTESSRGQPSSPAWCCMDSLVPFEGCKHMSSGSLLDPGYCMCVLANKLLLYFF